MYLVKQSRIKERFLLPNKTVIDTYKFVDYLDALKFAVNEQIKTIYIQPHKDSKPIKRKVFKFLYTLPEFKRVAKKSPLHFIGFRYIDNINLEAYYYYLVNSTNLLSSSNKLRKFM